MYDIIQELNTENGSNYKMAVLKKYADDDLLKRLLKMTYDTCTFTYGVTMKNVVVSAEDYVDDWTLEGALDFLEAEFVTRNTTGNDALRAIATILAGLSEKDADVFAKVLNRDLRINMGRSNINKVFKALIVKPVYMRCGTYNDKTKKKFNPKGSFVELKADGTYREFQVIDGNVSCQSRSGEKYEYPEINEYLTTDGVYTGEMTVYRDGVLLDRATGNGLLKKDVFPENCKVVFDCWDHIELDEYSGAANKIKGKTPFRVRRERLMGMFMPHFVCPMTYQVRCIESHPVNSVQEALFWTAKWMNEGLEGAVWKEGDAIFRDGTSPQQLKLKLEIDIEVRVTGFHEGKPGTVREKTFGSMTYSTDDGKIVGRVSGFSNAQLEEFNANREACIGKVMTVQCNDITQARGSDTWALSHPRFIEFRDDKAETDTFERAMESKEMAMMVEEET